MFVVDIDTASGVNTVHMKDCVHAVPEDVSGKEYGKLNEAGGYLEFQTVGEAVRYLKTNHINGVIHYCSYCKPTKKYNSEPAASLGVEIVPTGCDSMNLDSPLMQKTKKTVEVTDTKTIAKRLAEKLFGSR